MLLSKDENLKTSSVFVASLVLKMFQKKALMKLSIFEIAEELKKYGIDHYRQVIFGLSFLYSTGVADFKEPYVYISK